ncbi:MAG: 50S ribosomal protein L33 [Planctomycetota bacterium]|nr:MAG: 50S ribosomal protein L33 [Planctomycetota bacterium]
MAKSRTSTVVFLECSGCGRRNYALRKRTKATWKLELKKYCRFERKHLVHKERKK